MAASDEHYNDDTMRFATDRRKAVIVTTVHRVISWWEAIGRIGTKLPCKSNVSRMLKKWTGVLSIEKATKTMQADVIGDSQSLGLHCMGILASPTALRQIDILDQTGSLCQDRMTVEDKVTAFLIGRQ